MWSLLISVHLLIRVVIQFNRWKKIVEVIFHIVAWAVALLMTGLPFIGMVCSMQYLSIPLTQTTGIDLWI
jgi:hypothetical protein